MTLRDDALAVLRGWTAPDERQDALRREYVDHLDAHPDGAARSCHPDHLTTGALILSADASRVLLTLHAKAKRWFHLGGHCEPQDATLLDAARREAVEESGVEDLVVDPVPLHLDAHLVGFCAGHERVRHLDVRFLARAPEGAEPAVSEESDDVRWWPVRELPTDDPDMLRMVELALARR
ncbi:MAG: NUDIX domain-containing protein [Nocardioidaceae bacterium]|nr:NUDIX domain-containing protein [Nocardioidaceae bacterium]